MLKYDFRGRWIWYRDICEVLWLNLISRELATESSIISAWLDLDLKENLRKVVQIIKSESTAINMMYTKQSRILHEDTKVPYAEDEKLDRKASI